MKGQVVTKSRTAIDELEHVFKALADKTRLRILGLLGNDEVCVCHLHDSLGLPQPTVSRHLAYLRRSGLVTARRDGVWMHYQVSPTLDPVARGVVDAAVHALTHVAATARDRKQYQRSFGTLQPLETCAGGSCCAPSGGDGRHP
jgi:ArsR family transcriptional regulator